MSPVAYSRTAILLHWLVALCIAAAFALGIATSDLPISPARLKLINWHKWVGICVLALTTARLLWRVGHPPPASLAAPRWQLRAAAAAHAALYLLCVAMPVLGWLYSSAAGFPVRVFGGIPLPDLLSPDRSLAAALKASHILTGYLLALLIALHVAAALKHQFIHRNGLLERIDPRHLWNRALS